MSTYVNKMEMEQISYKILSSVVMVACSRHSDRRSRRLRRRKKKAREKLAFSIQRIRLSGSLEQAMVIDTLKQMMHHSDYRRLYLSVDTRQKNMF